MKDSTDLAACNTVTAQIDAAATGSRYELDPRTGGCVLASTMEKRRARNRARNTPTQARLRAEKRAREQAEIAALIASMPPAEPVRVSREGLLSDRRALRVWLALDLPRQRQLRKTEDRIFACRVALVRERVMRGGSGIEPTPAELAPAMAHILKRPVDRREARKTLEQVLSLEIEGGPWCVCGDSPRATLSAGGNGDTESATLAIPEQPIVEQG